MKAVSSMGLSQCEMDLVISARNVVRHFVITDSEVFHEHACKFTLCWNVYIINDIIIQPKACLEHYHLLLYTEEVLRYDTIKLLASLHVGNIDFPL